MPSHIAGISSSTAVLCALLVSFVPLSPTIADDVEPDPNLRFDPALYQALEFRSIGPYRGGRVTAVTGVQGERDLFYMGSTGGGVWSTRDGGTSWRNITDGQFEAASIGAVAVAPSDRNVLYVGTGSACPRGNVSPGVGVYRSTDAGKSWQHAGLRQAGQIGKIRVDPRDANRVFVAALGHVFGPNEERGVFRSTDGGASWQNVLYIDENTGAVDLALDRSNPRVIYAAMWEARRQPWEFSSGGDKSGLFRSRDGGDSWEEVEAGLPEGIKGRIGVSISAADPGRVWALVEAEDGGLFRSDDGGERFRRVNDDRRFQQRAWYYTHVYADPVDRNTVYVLNVGMYRSTDGGVDFTPIRGPHGDHHDLWIDPDDHEVIINGNDGGANVSYNGGRSWSTQANQPTAEFYRVAVDEQFPYRVYGAQQDNSTVSIASRTGGGGITRRHWHPIGGGESGHIAIDPRDPNVVYAGSYGGTITRYDHATGVSRNILAYPQLQLGQAPETLKYRFQWNAPIRISPHDPSVLYHVSNFVHRSTDEGESWEVISPDLTRDDRAKQRHSGGPITWDNTGVEVYGTVFAFEESIHERGELWAGTDDGRVHLSRDAGKTWDDVTPGGFPEWGQVNAIEISRHEPGRVLLAVTRYRLDDFAPYIFLTVDHGASWKRLTTGENGIPADCFVRAVREDPKRRGLLYAGTEFGLFVSFDEGEHWQSLQLNLPVTPITDMQVTQDDLVVATQGRSMWILDDLTPLHQLDSSVEEAEIHLNTPRDAIRFAGGGGRGRAGDPVGKNPPYGAVIFYVLDGIPEEEEVTLEIFDRNGETIRRWSSVEEEYRAPDPYSEFRDPSSLEKRLLSRERGLNRMEWNLRHTDLRLVEDAVLWGSTSGPKVVPGEYVVRLSAGDRTVERTLLVRSDPRLAATQEDYEAQLSLALDVRALVERAHREIEAIRTVRNQVTTIVTSHAIASAGGDLKEASEDLLEQLASLENRITQTKSESMQDPLNYPPMLDNSILYLYGIVSGGETRPTAGAVARAADLEQELAQISADLDDLVASKLERFNARVIETGAPPVVIAR